MSTPNRRGCRLDGHELHAPRRARRYDRPEAQIRLAYTPPLVPDDGQWWYEIKSTAAGAALAPACEADFYVGQSFLRPLPHPSTAPLKALSMHLSGLDHLSRLDPDILPEPPIDVNKYIAFLRLVRLSLVLGSAVVVGCVVAAIASLRSDADWLSQSGKPVAAITTQIRQVASNLTWSWHPTDAGSAASTASISRGDQLRAQTANEPMTTPTSE